MELWKPVKGYEPYYEISSLGRVRSADRQVATGIRHNTTVTKYGRTLKPNLKNNGYLSVVLVSDKRKSTVSIHRLVAINFMPNPHHKEMVNHINGIKTDNRLTNLEWCTASENAQHSIRTGLKPPSTLRKQVMCIETGQVFPSSYQAAEWVNTKYSYAKQIAAMGRKIRAVASGRQKTAYGYHWEDIACAISPTTSP